jgi:putative hydrolase of the HAD superfamily
MIKNIVFDLGRVMVEFDPLTYIRGFGFPEETNARLYEAVFGYDLYLHDRGDYETIEDLREAVAAKHPALEAEIRAVLKGDWVKIHYLKKETEAYLRELKARGFGIYILSNLSLESYEFIKQYDFFRLTDGGVFSYQERSNKPEEKIYRALLDRYALNPQETVFIDDNEANVAGAEALGIRTVLFTDIESARNAVEKIITEENV